MTQSISFDRAAEFYDETRGLPEEIVRKQADALVAAIGAAGADRVLEVGIGTGRIARPLAARGVPVVGVDIAPRMMAQLRTRLDPSCAPIDLVLGDATALPVADASVRAVLLVHVLHLVSDWRRALDEVMRVLAPDGIVLRLREEYLEPNPWRKTYAKWIELERARGFERRPRPNDEEMDEALRARGATLRTTVYAQDEDRWTPAGQLESTRNRIDSWTWQFPDELFAELLAEFAPWVAQEFDDLEAEQVQQRRFELDAWTLP